MAVGSDVDIVTARQKGRELAAQCGLSATDLAVVASDRGPGIPDLSRALEVGYSTSGSLGLGLPGVRRLMDDFEVESRVGRGTRVTARKWR